MYFCRSHKFGVLLCLSVVLCSCFVRKRIISVPGLRPNARLLTATNQELIERMQRAADRLQGFTMRMDMSPSVGSLYVGEVKDYATLGGYILFRKPDGIRILASDPVLGSTVFDMVSLGQDFRIYIPSKSQFIEGRNDVPSHSKKQLENLRPVAFLTSLIIQPPDPKTDITLIEEDTSGGASVYILLILRHEPEPAEPKLVRTITFDRRNLQIIRQKTYDASGGVVSDTTYSEWKTYNGIPFPSTIDIKRPQDHYEVLLNVLSMKMNPSDLTPEKFILNQPPGTQLQQLAME